MKMQSICISSLRVYIYPAY